MRMPTHLFQSPQRSSQGLSWGTVFHRESFLSECQKRIQCQCYQSITHPVLVMQIGFGQIDFGKDEDRSLSMRVHFRDKLRDITPLRVHASICKAKRTMSPSARSSTSITLDTQNDRIGIGHVARCQSCNGILRVRCHAYGFSLNEKNVADRPTHGSSDDEH